MNRMERYIDEMMNYLSEKKDKPVHLNTFVRNKLGYVLSIHLIEGIAHYVVSVFDNKTPIRTDFFSSVDGIKPVISFLEREGICLDDPIKEAIWILEDLGYKGTHSEGLLTISNEKDQTEITTHNLVKVFNQPDLSFEEWLKSAVAVFEKRSTMVIQPHHADQLYPILKGHSEEGWVHFEVAKELFVVFTIQSPTHLEFLKESHLFVGWEADNAIASAWANVEKLPWVNEDKTMSGDEGSFYMYSHDEPYEQMQFLTKIAKTHLGQRFYVTFPSRAKTIVFVPKYEAISTTTLSEVIHLKHIGMLLHSQEPYTISPRVYLIEGGEISCMG